MKRTLYARACRTHRDRTKYHRPSMAQLELLDESPQAIPPRCHCCESRDEVIMGSGSDRWLCLDCGIQVKED